MCKHQAHVLSTKSYSPFGRCPFRCLVDSHFWSQNNAWHLPPPGPVACGRSAPPNLPRRQIVWLIVGAATVVSGQGGVISFNQFAAQGPYTGDVRAYHK